MVRTIKERKKEAEVAYNYCKAVDKKDISYSEAVKEMVKSGVNKSSAKYYLKNFPLLLEGKPYTWSMNYITTEYFLENIRKDYPIKYLENAVKAVEGWIEYYENTPRKPKVVDIFFLLKKYIKILKDENNNEKS